MKGLVYHGNKDLRLETVPEPSPSRGDVKLRVDFCGICATDIEEYLYGPNFISAEPNPLTGRSVPLTTGHEITGTVVETGEGVHDVEVGQRAVFNGILTCGECFWCESGQTQQCRSMTAVGFGVDGGLTEYLVWPASHIVPLPENVISKEAALTEPASVASHAVKRANVSPGDRVAVLGVGTVGMLAMQIAKSKGAEVFAVDTRQMSLDMARDLGADAVIKADDPDVGDRLMGLTDGIGPDKIIDAAGGPQTPTLAVDWVRTGGRVVLVAIYTARAEIDFNTVVGTEKEIIGSIAYDQDDVEEVVRLISSGALKTQPLISGVIGLDEVIDVGFQRMMAPTKDIFRILVAPSGEM
jgi:(R,R)-butanediol dehydrogenase/meso-butanediol dehydrogenase/diacetyl reductase